MTTFRQTASTHNNWLVWVAVAMLVVMVGSNGFMRSFLMTVDNVHVYSSIDGDRIKMAVSRKIHRKYLGSYQVIVSRSGGEVVCEAAPALPFYYRPNRPLPAPLYMDWWLGGADRMANCQTQGMGPGVYIVETCHFWIGPFGIPLARQCADSNKFTIYPRSILTEPLDWPFSQPYGDM